MVLLLRLIELLDTLDPSAIPEAILRAALDALGLSTAWMVWIEDPPHETFSLIAAVGLPPELGAEGQASPHWSPCRCERMALRGERSEAISTLPCERLERLGLPAAHLTIPLRFRDHVYGVMNFLIPPGFQLRGDAQQTLTLAGRLGGAILGYLRALERLQRQYRQLHDLSRIAQLANQPLPLGELLNRITEEIVALLEGDRGAIALMAESSDHLRVVAEYNPIGTPSGLGVTIPIPGNPSMAWILQNRRPLPIADVASDPLLGPVQPILHAMGIRSLLIVPLVVEDRVIGTLGIDSVRQPRIFTPEEIRLAETVAAQVAGAIERARLLEAAQRRAVHLETLHGILREATEAQDLGALMDQVLSRLRALLNVPIGAIWLEGQAILHGLPEEFGLQSAAIARQAGLKPQEPLAVPDWAALPPDHPLQAMRNAMARFEIRSSLTVPLLRGAQRVGGLSLAAREPRSWQPEEIALLEAVGKELGAVAERLQLLQSRQAQTTRLHVLCQTARALAELQDLPTLLGQAVEEILTHLPADGANIYVTDEEDPDQLRVVVERGFTAIPAIRISAREDEETITSRVARRGEPLWVEDCARYPYPPATRQIIERERIRSHAALPLWRGSEWVGVLHVIWRTPQTFDAETRELLQSLADLLATGIQSARLLQRTQRQAQELAALNRALHEALRLREEMIQNVSHELRTPLAVAMDYLELLAEGALGPLNPEQREAITISRERLGELHRYVELLLTLQVTRAGELARIPLDLKQLVQEILHRWKTQLDPGRYRVVARLPAEEVWLIGDPEGLIRAIGEVLDNAVKFSPRGGTIEIALEVEGSQVHLRVRDEGIGIPMEQMERIGQPFYQVEGGTTRRFGGMGIGLAVARAVIEAHGGKLHIRPRAPQGTEVLLTLPRVQPAP